MRVWAMIAVAAAAALPWSASAAVVDSQPGGFEVSQTVQIAAPAAKVWKALVRPAQWWSPSHSWSGDAKNLSIDLKPGGCWCEALPKSGGGAWHMTVIFVDPPRTVRFAGALGPLSQTGADGRLTWSLAEKDGKTTLTQTYDVGGYMKGGISQIAGPVDNVLTEQLGRLKSYVETGKPG